MGCISQTRVRKMWKTCIAIFMAAGLMTVVSPAEKPGMSRFETVMQELVDAMNSARFEKIRSLYTEEMKKNYSLEATEEFFGNMVIENGKVRGFELLEYISPDQATFRVSFDRIARDFNIVLDSEDRLGGLRIFPHTNIAIPGDEQKHKMSLILPFQDRWKVLWGGDTAETNIYHDTPSQKYAVVFIGLASEGNQRFVGDGRKNTDYFAFGREVLAPAGGEVIEVIDGVRDNPPGSSNPFSALGNAIFIKHADGEVSVLAHLQQGSITVKPGDEVITGQVIARCGNSGDASEPMLHYHLQNNDVIQDALGVKCFFKKVYREMSGSLVIESDYTPKKGDIFNM